MSETNPVALVTGAARRVGAVIARTLHEAGYDVALHYRKSRGELDALADALESRRAHSTLVLQADLADSAQLPGLVDAVVTRFGRLDALVNNASIFHATPLGGITAAQCEEFVALRRRDSAQRRRMKDRSVVDQRVQPSEARDDGIDQPRQLRAVGKVGLQHQRRVRAS